MHTIPDSHWNGRSYGVGAAENHVQENPEWEKARQALASISKTQSNAKATLANPAAAEVSQLCRAFI